MLIRREEIVNRIANLMMEASLAQDQDAMAWLHRCYKAAMSCKGINPKLQQVAVTVKPMEHNSRQG